LCVSIFKYSAKECSFIKTTIVKHMQCVGLIKRRNCFETKDDKEGAVNIYFFIESYDYYNESFDGFCCNKWDG